MDSEKLISLFKIKKDIITNNFSVLLLCEMNIFEFFYIRDFFNFFLNCKIQKF